MRRRSARATPKVVETARDIDDDANKKRLVDRYSSTLATLRARAVPDIPALPPEDRDAFLSAYAAEAKAASDVDRSYSKSKEEQERAKAALERAQKASALAAGTLLDQLRPFLSDGGLDGVLVPCSVLADATPDGLAEYASKGQAAEALVDEMLKDVGLMRDMLAGGGAKKGKYGEAMEIYDGILKQANGGGKACRAGHRQQLSDEEGEDDDSWVVVDVDDSEDGSDEAAHGEGIDSGGLVLPNLALGTALELAVPVQEFGLKSFVDPVERYVHYEDAYLRGELDDCVPTLTTFEARYVSNSDAPNPQLQWCRDMLRSYRPDHVTSSDTQWRYVRIVRTDVAYKHPDWIPGVPRTYPQILNGGGECGPRAFFGRFALHAFGIPTWGVRQKGHAALSHYTPDHGWVVCLGADWRWNWWDDRSGPDFLLETEARKADPVAYERVLRAQWVGDVLGEDKVDGRTLGKGGLWNALALYQKRAIVAASRTRQISRCSFTASATSMANVPRVRTNPQSRIEAIVIGDDGSVLIPAASCSKPEKSTRQVLLMPSFLGGKQLHSVAGPPDGSGDSDGFEYTLPPLDRTRTYELSALVATPHSKQELSLVVTTTPANEETMNPDKGSSPPIVMTMPYTTGLFQRSATFEVELQKGVNVLRFTRNTSHSGLTIKQFYLVPLRRKCS